MLSPCHDVTTVFTLHIYRKSPTEKTRARWRLIEGSKIAITIIMNSMEFIDLFGFFLKFNNKHKASFQWYQHIIKHSILPRQRRRIYKINLTGCLSCPPWDLWNKGCEGVCHHYLCWHIYTQNFWGSRYSCRGCPDDVLVYPGSDGMYPERTVPAADSVGEQHTSMVPLINVLKIFIFELQQL